MTQQEILEKLAEDIPTEDLINSLKINSLGLQYYANLSLDNIEVKVEVATLFAVNHYILKMLNIKYPGFTELVKKQYDSIIKKYEIKLLSKSQSI